MKRNALYIILSVLLLLSLSVLAYAEVGAQGGQPQNGNGAVTPAQPFESGGAATAGDGGSADGSAVIPEGGAGAADTGGAGETNNAGGASGAGAQGDMAAQNAGNPPNNEALLSPGGDTPVGDQAAADNITPDENGADQQNVQNEGVNAEGANTDNAATEPGTPNDGPVTPTQNLTDTDDENNMAGIIAVILAGIILLALVIYALTKKKHKYKDDKDYPRTD